MEENLKENIPNLFESISLSFQTPVPQNHIIFISKSVPIVQPLAHHLIQNTLISTNNSKQSQLQLILLLDFDSQQIQWLNQCLSTLILTHPLHKKFDSSIRNQLKITRLNALTIQKRKNCYIRKGTYSLSCQIFLTDLLRGNTTINPKLISKVIVKLTQKVTNYYHYYAWLTTMLKIKQQNDENKWNLPFIFICNQVHHYSFEEQFKEVYRILFCNKVIIWPFGRSQIHKKLNTFRQKQSLREWEHTLAHSQNEIVVENILVQLYNFLKKTYRSKYGQKSKLLDDYLYTRTDQQSFMATFGQLTQFSSIKSLFSQLQNTNKITMLNTISRLIEQNSCQLWNSNNNEAIELIQTLINNLKDGIFIFQRVEPKAVDLKALIQSSKYGLQGNVNEIKKYICQYNLDVGLTIKLQENQKMNQLIKIIEDIKVQKKVLKQVSFQRSQGSAREETSQRMNDEEQKQLRMLEQKIGKRPQIQSPSRTIIIICNSKRTQKYVSSSLSNYISDNNYLDYLMKVHTWLKSQSPKRQITLRRIYEKRKIDITCPDNSKKDTKISQIQKVTESKLILEELLLSQIESLMQIMLDYELQQGMLNEQFRTAQSQGDIFDINQEEVKLLQTVIDKIRHCKFRVVDEDRVRLAVGRKRTDQIWIDSQNGKIRIMAEYMSKNAELTHFYSLLFNSQPEIIIFYSPSTTLLRSLYLYHTNDPPSNLTSLHILNYQNSFQSKSIQHEVIKEDKAFWQISQKRSSLSKYSQTPFSRIKPLNMRDNYDQALNSFNNKNLLRGQSQNKSFNLANVELGNYRRTIIVDSREFKSSLPSYLYHHGFQIIPMFLKTADYILSDEIAIEKKSVNTRDLHTSLKSDRLNQQLKRMNSSFRHPYLLIQFQEQTDVRKDNFARSDFGKNSNSSEGRQIRKKLFSLIHRYERIKIIWSTSVIQSCQHFKQLKLNKPEPDLSRFQKAQIQQLKNQLLKIPEISSSKQISQK